MAKEKLEEVPFKELLVSKKETLRNIVKRISVILDDPDYNEGRLLVKDKDFFGLKLQLTVGQLNV